MKIRDGFVSNSSSSSFIVALDRMPASKEELQQMFFGEETVYPNPYVWGNAPFGWPISQVVDTLWNDIQGGPGPLTEEAAFGIAESGHLENADYPDYPDYDQDQTPESRQRAWDEFHAKRDKASRKAAGKFLGTVKDKMLLVFTYSDNDGPYFTALEHGPLFSRVPHLRVSHH